MRTQSCSIYEIAANPDPKIPDTLLPASTDFPVRSEEFQSLEPNLHGEMRPKYAVCRIEDETCQIFSNSQTKQFTLNGNLAKELPVAEWEKPTHTNPLVCSIINMLSCCGLLKRSSNETQMLMCPRPELGPKTKKAIADLTSRGWEEIHLVWDSESNWTSKFHLVRKLQFKETALIVVGESHYDFRVVAQIPDRTK